MQTRTYWLDIFSIETWQQFLDAGATVSGFTESQWSKVQRLQVGDYLLCYLTGASRFVGVLEVESEPYRDTTRSIWNDDFPCRVKVRTVITLTPETAVPITDLRERLSIFSTGKPNAWSGHVRQSPTRWLAADGEAVVEAVREAKSNPVQRPLRRRQRRRRPEGVPTEKFGTVTVPGHEEPTLAPALARAAEGDLETTAHTEVQWMLLKLGNDLGLDVWVARNDRNRNANGKRFADLPRMRQQLPRQFDEATTRTIELIDVLWLKANAIVAAFEVESTTVIYSGLLRMSDLLAMQPNLNIPLYVVAPDERRDKVVVEVNRPTFSRLTPPLKDACRFISFSTLHQEMPELERFVQHLKPDILDSLSESCHIEHT